MEFSLQSPFRKALLLIFSFLAAAGYTALTAREALAAYFASTSKIAGLTRAVALDPGNAEYRYLSGRYHSLIDHDPEAAAQSFRAAVSLNPHQARYWFDLAAAYQRLGDDGGQRDALEHATIADPTTPDVAWEAANFYAVAGETEKALKEFRVVLANDPYLPPAALALCWRLQPDADALLQNVLPPIARVYSFFLEYLVSKNETAAAAKVWDRLIQLHQPIDKRYLFAYENYLIVNQQPDQARLVWQQSAGPCGMSAYQPTTQNLVVNGDFSLPVMNGGFDWRYHKSDDVELALDPTQFHGGNRSLSLIFNSRGIEDAGIRQVIAAQPNTAYDFTAFFKADDIEGAGGPRFMIQDLYTSAVFLTTDEMKDADFWKQVTGNFTTGPDTKMLVLRIQRDPPNNAIKGRLWIDSVRLVQKGTQE